MNSIVPKIKNIFNQVINFLLISAKDYISIAIHLLIAALCVRLYEAFLLAYFNTDFFSALAWNLKGFLCDILLFCKASLIVLPVFVLIFKLNRKAAILSLRIFWMILLFLSLICVTFFVISGYFLDAIIFSYSLKEIINILQSSTKAPFWGYVIIFLIPFLFFIFSKKQFKISKVVVIIFLLFLAASPFISIRNTVRDSAFFVQENKARFFIKSVFYRSKPIEIKQDADFENIVNEFHNYFPQYQFLDPQYPFLYKADYEDVLSPFFALNEEPPNIVLVLVEGLSMEILDSQIVIMPFLDSLSKESLFWNHCFSTTGRTYGALPALLGALPIGTKGFMARSPYTPESHTLAKTLKNNGYQTGFYYGGWYDFDNMKKFMEENLTPCMNLEWDEDIEKENIGAFWGKEDHLMFLQSLRKINKIPTPRLDLYLTLSTHDPWEYPESEYYQQIFIQRISQNKILSEQEKSSYIREAKVYASFCYLDDALRTLIDGYSKRDDFRNTIFVITGDHSPFVSQLRGAVNYQVPFLIYSPMLKNPQKFNSVITHRDFTPTFLAMLSQKYNFETPQEVAWLNSKLNTTMQAESKTFSPLYSSDKKIVGVLYHENMLCEDILYELDDSGNFREVDDKNVYNKLNRLMTLYNTLDFYVFENNKLIKPKNESSAFSRLWFNDLDTISSDSRFVKKWNGSIVYDQIKHSDVLCFGGGEKFLEIFAFNIPDNMIDAFKIEIEFDFYVENNEDNPEQFFVIHDFIKSKQTQIREDFTRETLNKWCHYSYSYTFNKGMHHYKSGDKCAFYLYNPNDLNGRIDNIRVKCMSN